MEASYAIEVRGLTKRFKNAVLANDGIDLQVPKGTIFGLLGPNGSGKTTFVRQITGELLPTSGEIRVAGIDVLKRPTEAKRLMDVVPQESGVFFALTAEENMRIFGQLHGFRRAEAKARAEALLLRLNLLDHGKTIAQRLSGGMIRKLVVGMALIGQAEVLVLDEPTTGLDPHSRREVWSLIRDHQRAGATVLLTTHYMEEAEALCDRVAILAKGRIIAVGTVENIRSLCRNQFKATYEEEGEPRILYGQNYEEVSAQLDALGLVEYTVSKTSLEDLYLELTQPRDPVRSADD